MATFLNDTFTAADGTALEARVGELGAAWTVSSTRASGAAVITTNRLRSNSDAESAFRCSALSPVSGNESYTAIIRHKTSTGNVYVYARFAHEGQLGYRAFYDSASGEWGLQFGNGFPWDPLGTNYAQALSADTDYTLKLQIIDGGGAANDTVKLFVDGVERISAAAGVTQGQGCPGIGFSGNSSSSTGLHVASLVGDSDESAPSFATAVAFTLSGDSLCSDTYRPSYPTVAQLLAAQSRWNTDRAWNFSIGGETIATMITRGTAEPGSRYALTSGFTKRIALLVAGGNDLAQGGTALSIWQAKKDWCEDRQAEGYLTLVTTIAKAEAYVGADETTRSDTNDLLEADHSFADYYVDIASLTEFSNPFNEVYFYTDHNHWTTAGATAAATAIASALTVGSTYYVTTTGNDTTGNGSIGTPWLTIQKASNTMVAGDTVIIGAGTFPEVVTIAASGSAGLPISYVGQGDTTIIGGDFGVAGYFSFNAKSYINISNMKFTGDGYSIAGGFININGLCQYLNFSYFTMVQEADVLTPRSGAFVLNPVAGVLPHHITINHVVTQDLNGLFVNGYGNDVTVTNCVTWGNAGWDLIQMLGARWVISDNDFTLDNTLLNEATHPDFFQTFSDADHVLTNNIVLERNFFRGLSEATGGLQIGNTGDTSGAIECHDVTFRNNVFMNISRGFNLGIQDTKWYNNTYYRCAFTQSAVILGYNNGSINWTGANIRNNLFVECADASMVDMGWYGGDNANVVGDYNLVIGTGAGTTKDGTWLTGNGPLSGTFETNGINGADPLFVAPGSGNFRLQAGSPAIGAGTDLSSMFTNDITGAARSGWDMGAYSYSTTGAKIFSVVTLVANSIVVS